LTAESRTSPRESTDGTRVFYAAGGSGHSQIWSASVNGGDERRVTGLPEDAEVAWNWAVAPGGIYFFPYGGHYHGNILYFLELTTGHIKMIADLPQSDYGPGLFSISRDGHILFYSEVEHGESDIMLVEGFH
jgi:hypothetical protein